MVFAFKFFVKNEVKVMEFRWSSLGWSVMLSSMSGWLLAVSSRCVRKIF